MEDRSKMIFGNPVSKKDYRKAVRSKRKYIRRFGDDSSVSYPVSIRKNQHIGDLLGVSDIHLCEDESSPEFDVEHGVIVANIRMGFGHYRIAMAVASAANERGYKTYWLDLSGYPQTTASKVVNAQNKLYSLGSKLSANALFNRLIWEPLNYEGFRQLSYNASDQKNAELMAAVYRNIPKEIPVIATHVWAAQAAVHAGMKYVINVIPDNWPMALHLAEGSLHTVQCHYAYQGYRILNGMNKKRICKPMPNRALVYTGHYVDHELVSNIRTDCEARMRRIAHGEPMRFLLSVGGAGAQKEIFAAIIRHLLPAIEAKKAVLFINVGDHRSVWDALVAEVPEMRRCGVLNQDDWGYTQWLVKGLLDGLHSLIGISGFCHKNIFEAVYSTNLLMRVSDVLVTKPSELAFYPIPKLFIRRVGKHEMWGAIHSAEIGDGTIECRDIPHILQMLELFMENHTILYEMCRNIMDNQSRGIYDGAENIIGEMRRLKEWKSTWK